MSESCHPTVAEQLEPVAAAAYGGQDAEMAVLASAAISLKRIADSLSVTSAASRLAPGTVAGTFKIASGVICIATGTQLSFDDLSHVQAAAPGETVIGVADEDLVGPRISIRSGRARNAPNNDAAPPPPPPNMDGGR